MKIMNQINIYIDKIIRMIYPNQCIFCQETQEYGDNSGICFRCAALIPYAGQATLRDGVKFVERNYAAMLYSDMTKAMIYRYKYKAKSAYAAPCARLMFEHIACDAIGEIDFFTPVPLHPQRLKERGFNQAALLAVELSKLYEKPYCDCLIRCKNTAKQFNLTQEQRQINMHNAFDVGEAYNVQDKTVMLVDDIYTTGSTLEECAKILLSFGAKKVLSMTLTITYLDPDKPVDE